MNSWTSALYRQVVSRFESSKEKIGIFHAKRTECVQGPVLSPWFLVVALFTSARAKGLTDDISSIDIGPYTDEACCADIKTLIGAIARSGFAAVAKILELTVARVCTSVGT